MSTVIHFSLGRIVTQHPQQGFGYRQRREGDKRRCKGVSEWQPQFGMLDGDIIRRTKI